MKAATWRTDLLEPGYNFWVDEDVYIVYINIFIYTYMLIKKQHDRVEHSRLSVLFPRETHWVYCRVGRQPFLFGNSSWPRTLEIKLEIHPVRLVYLEPCSAHVRMLGFSSWSLHICLEIRSEFHEIKVVRDNVGQKDLISRVHNWNLNQTFVLIFQSSI